jgi:hypothetical protein
MPTNRPNPREDASRSLTSTVGERAVQRRLGRIVVAVSSKSHLDAFALVRPRLDELINAAAERAGFDSREAACASGWIPSPRDLVITAAGLDDSADAFEHDSPASILAWLAYALSISAAAGNPSDVAPHGLIGCSARGPEPDGECLVLLVRAEGRCQVASPPIAASDLLDPTARNFDDTVENLRSICERLIQEANELLPAARGVSAAAPWGGEPPPPSVASGFRPCRLDPIGPRR